MLICDRMPALLTLSLHHQCVTKQGHADANVMSVQMMVKTKTTVLNLRQPTYTMG